MSVFREDFWQHRFELLPCFVNRRADGAGRDVQERGDLTVVVLVEKAEAKDLRLAIRQPTDRTPQELVELATGGNLRWAGALFDHVETVSNCWRSTLPQTI